MRIQIIPYSAADQEALRAFDARLHYSAAALSQSSALVMHNPLLMAEERRPGDEYYLARDEKQTIHGMYILRRQEFWIGDRVTTIGCYSLPVSEGIIDQAYTPLGVQLLLDASRRQPLMYGLGMGGYDERLPQLLIAAGWRIAAVPFFFHVIHPAVFLRNIAYLRRWAPCARLFDLLALSGLGWLGIKALQAVHRPLPRDPSVTSRTVEQFAEGSDALWEACKDHYAMCAVRNRAVLQVLYPAADKRFIRLRVFQGEQMIGWAVLLDTQLDDHKYFGDMRLGSIVDCFAAPAHARTVVACARRALVDAGVDLIVSNQAHHAWCDAHKACGFLRGPSNFLLGTSPALTSLLRRNGRDMPLSQMHFNRGDGDGPIHL
jgi:hypothetical protein